MIGVDTNVLVRYLTQDDPAQARKANELIGEVSADGGRLHVDVIVLCELAWVLKGAYGFDRATIASTLGRMLDTSQFAFDDKDLIREALSAFNRGAGDLADCVIGARNRKNGCDHTLTFDRALKRNTLFKVL